MRQEPSIDAILRGLTDRPNVESTLILSRKDGSIIKTSGFAPAERRRRAQSAAPFQPPEAATQNKDQGSGPEDTVGREKLHPATALATTIFDFMKAAGSLGATLTTVAEEQNLDDASHLRRADATGTGAGTEGLTEEVDARRTDSQVQLLRLRVKHREIIIFPDPQYLCCVVQRVTKQHSGNAR